MRKIIFACVTLLVMYVLNPSIDAHKSAFMLQLDRDVEEAYAKGGFLTKIGLTFGGDELKSSLLDSLRRKDYVLFSLGYFDGKLVTVGALGCVHLCE